MVQFSLKPSDIHSNRGAGAVKYGRTMQINTRRLRCQSNVQHSRRRQLSSLWRQLLRLCCPGKTSLPVTTVRGSEMCFKWFLEHKANSLMANGPSLNLTFFFCGVPIRQRMEIVFCLFFSSFFWELKINCHGYCNVNVDQRLAAWSNILRARWTLKDVPQLCLIAHWLF